LVKPFIALVLSMIPVEIFKFFVHLNPYLEMVVGSIGFILVFAVVIRLLKLDDEDQYILGMFFRRFKRLNQNIKR